MASGYAVVDVETTGLLHTGHDRVVEVSVVHVDTSGRITGEWDTLVNPGRDLGTRELRRIRTSDVRLAPTFGQILPELCALLEGRVVVAHNAGFATGFLSAEFGREGVETPATIGQPLCTMQLARRFAPGSGRSLGHCAAALGVDRGGIHRASTVAWETAELLGRLIRLAPLEPQWGQALRRAVTTPWPIAAPTGFSWAPRPRAMPAEPTFLSRLTECVPGDDWAGDDRADEHLDYLALLDRALVDRALSRHDSAALVESAMALGIDSGARRRLHAGYFERLVNAAQALEPTDPGQLADLTAVADLLDVDPGIIPSALLQARGA